MPGVGQICRELFQFLRCQRVLAEFGFLCQRFQRFRGRLAQKSGQLLRLLLHGKSPGVGAGGLLSAAAQADADTPLDCDHQNQHSKRKQYGQNLSDVVLLWRIRLRRRRFGGGLRVGG